MLPQLALFAACVLQCTDPPTPAGGFAYDEALDQQITFSDGETTTAVARWPRDPAGACGWPLLVITHGLFGSKVSLAQISRDFAENGYFVVTYDVRGHATSSGYHTLWGQRERLDIVEIIHWAQTQFPTLIDPERIGLSGNSQGGILSLATAAWGGQPIEPNPWLTGTYPVIDAIAVENLTGDFAATFAPTGRGVQCNAAGALLGTSEVRFDPTLVQDALRAVLEEDYPAWSAIIGDPTRDPGPLVPDMTTPTLVLGAWDDFWFPPSVLISRLDQMSPSVPRRVYLGTIGHSTPTNNGERQIRRQLRRDWLDHFLKSVENGVEVGPRFAYSVTPSSVDDYLALDSQWQHESSDVWPPADTFGYRLFLRENGELWPSEPKSAETPDVLHHFVNGIYGPSDVVSAEFRLPQIEAEVPRVWLQWDSAPLLAPLRFTGEPRVTLATTSTSSDWQISASLWDIDPNGEERYLTGGTYFHDTPGTENVASTIQVSMGANAFEFPAGHVVRVRLDNLAVHEPPVGTLLRFEPTLHSYDVEVRHDTLSLSWLELPVAQSELIPFGWSQTNSLGCTPAMTITGNGSITDSTPLALQATQILSHKEALLVYGYGPDRKPLGGHFLFLRAPTLRVNVPNSGGTPGTNDCSGVLDYDFKIRLQSGRDPALVPGARIDAQYWSRDPAAPSTTNLTNAVEFSVLP